MTMDNWYYETIITKLDEIVAVMNTEECMEEIHNNQQLAEAYFVLNSVLDKFQKVQGGIMDDWNITEEKEEIEK